MNYQEAKDLIQGSRNGRYCLKRSHLQVWLEPRDEDVIALKLNESDIMLFKPDGSIVLDTCGWEVATTKSRMNDYLPRGFRIYQERGIWYMNVGMSKRTYTYADGLTIHADGSVTGNGPLPAEARKRVNAVNRYAKNYARALWNGNVPAPSGADCFYCSLRDADSGQAWGEMGDAHHIVSHIEEAYYVPSLLVRAVEIYPVSPFTGSTIAGIWEGNALLIENLKDLFIRQVSASLKKYCKAQLGMAH